jgi:hypothetical protein
MQPHSIYRKYTIHSKCLFCTCLPTYTMEHLSRKQFHSKGCENPTFQHLSVNYEEARPKGQLNNLNAFDEKTVMCESWHGSKYDLLAVHMLDHYWVRNQIRPAVCAHAGSLPGTQPNSTCCMCTSWITTGYVTKFDLLSVHIVGQYWVRSHISVPQQ